MGNYDDIIDLPRHISKRHAPMPVENRAAQFMPFAALTGYDASVREEARLTGDRAELSEEQIRRLNDRLSYLTEHITTRPTVTITFFLPDAKKKGGAYVTKSGKLRHLDLQTGTLIFTDDVKIPLADVLDIAGECFNA